MPQTFVVAACVAVFRRGRILLLRRGPEERSFIGFWEMPGGAVEEGESLVRAARREAREESGLRVALGSPAHFTEWRRRERRYVQVTYLATAPGTPEPGDGMDGARWATEPELAALRMTRSQRESVAAAFAAMRRGRR
jgi:8-oxo-dGTP diphosphatase